MTALLIESALKPELAGEEEGLTSGCAGSAHSQGRAVTG